MIPLTNIYSNNLMRMGYKDCQEGRRDIMYYAQLSMRESRISPMTADDV